MGLMYVYLCSLSACLKKCTGICLIISLFFLRQKVCKISLITTYERCQVVTMQASILQTLLLTEERNVPFNDIQTKYQSL